MSKCEWAVDGEHKYTNGVCEFCGEPKPSNGTKPK